MGAVLAAGQGLRGAAQIIVGDQRGRQIKAVGRLNGFRETAGTGLQLVTAVHPGVVYRREHLAEGRHTVARFRREVSAAVERLALGRHEDRHGPAAVAGEQLDGGHVDLVHVGALLAVHLDGYEVLVQDIGGFLVLERFALHHVTPVTGGVAHAEEDGFAAGPGLGEGLVAPGVPVHRVVLVLEQVGAGLGGEAVGHQVTIGWCVKSSIVRARHAVANAWPGQDCRDMQG